MRRLLTILGSAALIGAGLTVAVALASGSGTSSPHRARHATTATAESDAVAVKAWLCHHTGSTKHPYHVIHVSSHAVPTHRRHGDVAPGAGNSCPAGRPAGTKAHGHDSADQQDGQAKEKDDATDADDANDGSRP